MERIEAHELRDTYRLRPGVLLVVSKYKLLEGRINYNEWKRYLKKIRGLSGGYVSTVEIQDYRGTYPTGTIFLNKHYPVEPVSDPSLFTTELKLSGGGYMGSIGEMETLLQEVYDILETYRP